MKRPLILCFVLMLPIPRALNEGEAESFKSINELESKLNTSKIDLYSTSTHLFLMIQTEQKILNPDTLWTAFNCSLIGRNLLVPPIDLPISMHATKSFPKTFGGANFALNENYHFRYIYVLKVMSFESGYVYCEDNLRLGLKSKDVLHTAGYHSSVVARFSVDSMTTVAKAIMQHDDMPSLIFVDTDKIGDPEMTIRLESTPPNQEDTLLKSASEFVKEFNLTVRYIRSTTFCPLEKEGNFTWPATKVGRRAAPVEPCINDKGIIGPSRRCIGNQFEGAHWEPVGPWTCLIKAIHPSSLLDSVYEENPNAVEGIRRMIDNKSQFGAAQINLASIGLNIAARKNDNISALAILEVVDALLGVEKEVLKSTAMTSSSLETILEVIDQNLPDSLSEQSSPIIRKHLSAVSFRSKDSYRGFAVANSKTITLLGAEKNFDLVLESQPDVAVYRVEDSLHQRIHFLVMENDAIFRSFDQRVRVVGPVVGVGIPDEGLEETLVIAFKIDGNYSSEPQCAMWNPKTDVDWSMTSGIFSSGVATIKNGDERMRVCIYNVMHSGFIFFSQVYKEQSFVSTQAKESAKPEMELRYNKWTSKAFLTVKNYAALEVKGPVIDALKCSINNEKHSRFYSQWLDTNAEEILYEQAIPSSKHLNDWKIFEVSHNGHGILNCKDRLGLGVVSNDILVTSQNIAVVKFKNDPLDNLKDFAFFYPFNYGRKFKMSVRIQPDDRNSFSLTFSQFSEKNHTKFMEALEKLSNTLESEYKWQKSYTRSAQECPAIKETATWPATLGNHYAAPLDPTVDSYGQLSPKRLCLGSHEEGFFWEKEPINTNGGKSPLERMELLRIEGEHDDKMEAMNKIARIITHFGQKNLNEAEIWIVNRALKDAAHEVIEKRSKLRNVTSLAIIVDFLLRSKNHIQGLTANSTNISIKEPVNILLASSVHSNPIYITMPHFSAFIATLNGKIKGFELYESSAMGKYIEVRNKNSSVDETESRSMKTAVYISDEKLQNVTMVATIFDDECLFYPPAKGMLGGPVVGLALFSKDELLEHDEPTEITILFQKDLADYTSETCKLWNSNQVEGWSNIGCKNLSPNSIPGIEDMTVCICTHAAYFASITPLPSTHDMVPVFGCYIALLPLLVIFIYIGVNRKSIGERHKIQVQDAMIYFIQVITFIVLFSYKVPTKVVVYKLGLFLGAMVHFCLLASLLWCFISTLHLTLKYIPRLSELVWGRHLLVASLYGWIVPSTIVIISLLVDNHSYERVPWTLLYYPMGASLYILVVVPLVILFLVNIGVLLVLFKYEKWSPQFVTSNFHLLFILLFWIFGLIIFFTSDNASPAISVLFLMVSCIHAVKLLMSVFCLQDDTRRILYIADRSNINLTNTYIAQYENSEGERSQQGRYEDVKEAFHKTETEILTCNFREDEPTETS